MAACRAIRAFLNRLPVYVYQTTSSKGACARQVRTRRLTVGQVGGPMLLLVGSLTHTDET